MNAFYRYFPIAILILTILLLAVAPYTPEPPSDDKRRYEETKILLLRSIKSLMRIFITVILLPSSLYVILSKKFKKESEKWAYATVGTLVGYWLA